MALVVDLELLYRLVAVVESLPTWNLDLFALALGVSRKTVFNIIERFKIKCICDDIVDAVTRKVGMWEVPTLGLLDNEYAKEFIDIEMMSYKL